jgi:cytochrome c oxidase assembly factor CtaG
MTPDLAWDLQPWVIVSLAVACYGYGRGLTLLPEARRGHIFGAWRIASFCAGIAVLVVALLSPLSSLDDQLFSAHMAQHLLLMLVAPPLLVYSRPVMAWMCALPPGGRRWVAGLWSRRRGLQHGATLLMNPVSVWVLASAVLWFWHLPAPYRWVLQNEGVHTLEHFLLFATSLMFWSVVIEPYGRRHTDYGLCLLFVTAFSVEMSMLGAILTFASHPLYTADPTALLPWGLTPLQDQQLAGVVMWVPVGLIHLSTMAILFLAWLNHAERRAQSVVARLLVPNGGL